jgi:hypothetical protein
LDEDPKKWPKEVYKSWKSLIEDLGKKPGKKYADYRNEVLAYAADVSCNLKDLAESCMKCDSEERPEFSEILEKIEEIEQKEGVERKKAWPLRIHFFFRFPSFSSFLFFFNFLSYCQNW